VYKTLCFSLNINTPSRVYNGILLKEWMTHPKFVEELNKVNDATWHQVTNVLIAYIFLMVRTQNPLVTLQSDIYKGYFLATNESMKLDDKFNPKLVFPKWEGWRGYPNWREQSLAILHLQGLDNIVEHSHIMQTCPMDNAKVFGMLMRCIGHPNVYYILYMHEEQQKNDGNYTWNNWKTSWKEMRCSKCASNSSQSKGTTSSVVPKHIILNSCQSI
jgi:hypothetical protein